MCKSVVQITIQAVIFLMVVNISACSREQTELPLDVPRGYSNSIEFEKDGRILTFGPFSGYYFSPVNPEDLSRLKFICFNERSFYTLDLPENTKLFEGDAVLQTLAQVDFVIPADDRINPILFSDAPAEWLENRPEPQNEYVHFHSAHDALGFALTGYWMRHEGTAEFTYDMGGRVGPESVLYHEVVPGVDTAFAQIIEFDKGPALQ